MGTMAGQKENLILIGGKMRQKDSSLYRTSEFYVVFTRSFV